MSKALKTALLCLAIMSILIQGCGDPESPDFVPRGDDSATARHIVWRLKNIEAKIDAMATKEATR